MDKQRVNDLSEKTECNHEITWLKKRFLGVFPKKIKGICIHCSSQFEKEIIGKEEYVKQISQ